jgi:putative transposase
MPQGLERRYGKQHLHFITFSCYQRLPLLKTAHARDVFLRILDETRTGCRFLLTGYVVMPEHVHLLMGEPETGTPSRAIQVLKQRVSRELRKQDDESPASRPRRFWHSRFYDFNVWSKQKRNEKLHYIHFNPVTRGLVADPKEWRWSSYRFYWLGERGVCAPDQMPW